MKPMRRILVLAVAAALGGCVERTMEITSEPSGALVILSDVEIGRTPLTHEFTWYGDYDVIVRMEGHETLKTHAHINPPWYEVPPLDLLSAVAPWTYRDQRYLHYELKKFQPPAEEDLIRRAEQMRQRNLEPVEGSK